MSYRPTLSPDEEQPWLHPLRAHPILNPSQPGVVGADVPIRPPCVRHAINARNVGDAGDAGDADDVDDVGDADDDADAGDVGDVGDADDADDDAVVGGYVNPPLHSGHHYGHR